MSYIKIETIAIVKDTSPTIRQNAMDITKLFYERLLKRPEVSGMFDPRAIASGDQPKRLAGAILAYAEHIDRLDKLGPALDKMAKTHVTVGVKEQHYPIVAEELMIAIRDVLGDAIATDAVMIAWNEAYWYLANLLISAEKLMYAENC